MPTVVTRRQVFASSLVTVGRVVARPDGDAPGGVECQPVSIAVLPVTGVFAKHESAHTVATGTPAHAVLIRAGEPYRISYPGAIGDACLTLRVTPDVLEAPASRFAAHVLLPARLMLARERLRARLASGTADALEIEERSLDLLAGVLDEARTEAARRAAHARSTPRMARGVARAREAIDVRPERPWTLSRLAAAADVSPWQLARVFRREVGETVHGYVLRARLARALDSAGPRRRRTERRGPGRRVCEPQPLHRALPCVLRRATDRCAHGCDSGAANARIGFRPEDPSCPPTPLSSPD